MSLPKNRVLKVTVLSIALASAVAGPSAATAAQGSPDTLDTTAETCDWAAHPIEIWLTKQQVQGAIQHMDATQTNVATVFVPGSQVYHASNVSFVEVTLPYSVAVAAATRLQEASSDNITFRAAPQELVELPVTGGYTYSSGSKCMYGRQDDGDNMPPPK
jgi:hypothetical protein